MKPSDIMRTMVRDGFQVNIGGLVEDVVPVSVLREELMKMLKDDVCYSSKLKEEVGFIHVDVIKERFAYVLKEK